jgi:uncharacterized membrane protein
LTLTHAALAATYDEYARYQYASERGSTVTTPSSSAGLTSNVAGALCYLLGPITGIAFLVMQPYNQDREVRFHAFQSIFLSVAWIIVSVVLNVVTSIGPLGFLYTVTWLVSLAALGVWLYMMFQTYQGRRVVLPVVGPLAEQQVR